MVCHCINYTTFLTTAFCYVPCILISAYLVLTEQVKLRYDPYTLEPADNDRTYFQAQMVLHMTVVFSALVHHYLVQKDLLILTIEK